MKEEQSSAEKADKIKGICSKYYDDVYKYVYREIQNRQMAEEIAQDTFLAALENANELLLHPHPKLWLLRTSRNKMHKLYRWMKQWKDEPLTECEETAEGEVRDIP